VRREVGAFARLLDEEKRLRQASTLLGRALSVIGDVFSGYCVVKVGLAVRSILQHGARRTGVDPVTRAIGYALRLSLLDPGTLIATDDLPCMQALTTAPSTRCSTQPPPLSTLRVSRFG